MKLVIAGKPSVAMSLASVLGASERREGYLEGNGYIVSWCVGHLLELAQPEAYDPEYTKWRREHLLILPKQWKYDVPKDKKKQLTLLCRLMKDPNIDSIVCATDAGREGELIFRLVYNYSRCTKPVQRLWISSMEDDAIREGFAHLRPGRDYDRLYWAAVCRAGADWIVGINATLGNGLQFGAAIGEGQGHRLSTHRRSTAGHEAGHAAVQREVAISDLVSNTVDLLLHSRLRRTLGRSQSQRSHSPGQVGGSSLILGQGLYTGFGQTVSPLPNGIQCLLGHRTASAAGGILSNSQQHIPVGEYDGELAHGAVSTVHTLRTAHPDLEAVADEVILSRRIDRPLG